MAEDINGIIAKLREKGYSDEDIKFYLTAKKGVKDDEVDSFFEEKKNSDSTSDFTSETESMESPSAIDTTQPTEEVSSDSDSRIAQINRTRDLAGIVYDINSDSKTDTDSYDNQAFDFWAEQPAGFTQAGGEGEGVKEDDYAREANIRNQQAIAFEEGKSLEEIQDIRLKQGGKVEKANQLWNEAFPEEQDSFFMEDENGFTVANPQSVGTLSLKLQEIQEEDEKRLQKELNVTEDLNEVQEFLYDMNSGLRGIGYGLQGIWNPEQAQYNLYNDQFRTKASLLADGVSEEQQALGITKNAANGDWDAATAIFMTQLANTVPQLAIQAAIAAGTGGLGLSTTASIVASSSFMGATTFGTTNAQNYGLVPDSKRYIMAFGDALVETLSEAAFPDDFMALTKKSYKGFTKAQIRDIFFGKGIMTREFRDLALKSGKRGAIQFIESGLEEGAEEIIATIGSQWIHASINDEEFNLIEAVDAFIVGFGAGAGSRGYRGAGEVITATASSMGFGGLRTDYLKIRGAKQKLAQELAATTDATQKAQIQSKIDELTKIELQHKSEEQAIYSQYSDEDAQATIEANQQFQNAMRTMETAETQEQKAAAQQTAKAALETIKTIETKYDAPRAQMREQREINKNFNFGEQGMVDVNSETDAQGSLLVEGLKRVAKGLGTKVTLYNSYDAMAANTGKKVSDVRGNRGMFRGQDGSIHIMLPAALENTGYHEAFHFIARGIDPKYMERFVEAAIQHMPAELAEKYNEFGKMYNKEDKQTYIEEIFAELNADLTTGVITMEGSANSIASAAMGVVRKALSDAGLPVKTVPSFKEFAEYVGNVHRDLGSEKGVEAPITPFNREYNRIKADLNQLIETQSPAEILSEGFMPYNSTITQKLALNEDGNFVFYHRSPALFSEIDPSKFGQNLKTSKEERLQVGLAGVSVSMFATSPSSIDVGGQYLYKLELSPKEVYNAVDDPEGIVAEARAALKAEGKAASGNTLYAKATKMASDKGYKATVTPWQSVRVKIQTVEKLPVTQVQDSDPSIMGEVLNKFAPNGYDTVQATDVRTSMNEQAKSLYNKTTKAVLGEKAYDDIYRLTYAALDGRYGNPANIEEYIERLESFLESVDTNHPDADFVSAQLTEAIREAGNFKEGKGYRRRIPNDNALTKAQENAWSEISKGEDSFGFTIDPITGEFMTDGTIVGDRRSEEKFKMVDVGVLAVAKAEIMRKIEAAWNIALQNPRGTIGGWWNSKAQNENGDDMYYLDSGEVYADQKTAERLGRERKELGVYNITTGEYIPTSSSEEYDQDRMQKIDMDGLSEVERMTMAMNMMPIGVVNWQAPDDVGATQVNPIELYKSMGMKFPKKLLNKLGYESVDDMVKSTSDFDGMPTMPAMSDILAAGTAKDANGNPLDINGGIGANVFGVLESDGAAWAGVNKHEAQVQLDDAMELYTENKELFERLWAEKRLPYGHVPMMVMRMADTAINSNEAVFRYYLPLVQNYSKENRMAALKALQAQMQEDLAWLEEKQERHEKGMSFMEKGTRKVDPKKKQKALSSADKNMLKATRRLLKFIENNNIETVDHLFEAIAEDAHDRARNAITKEDSKRYLQLVDKEYLTSIMLRPHAEKGYIVGYANENAKVRPFHEALAGEDAQALANRMTFQEIADKIGDPIMNRVPANHAVAVMGIDVLNPAVVEVSHQNYGFGPRGRFIAWLSDPQHGADIFPEWQVKLARLAKKGNVEASKLLTQVGSTFFGDKAFRGAEINYTPSMADMVVAKLRYAFPFVHVSREQTDFDRVVEESGADVKFSKKGAAIYGITKGNRIFINPTDSSVETPIHEFGHIWLEFLQNKAAGRRTQATALWEKAQEVAKETELYQEKLAELGNETDAVVEALAELIGKKGAQIQEAATKSKFLEWMKGLFEYIKSQSKTFFSKANKMNAQQKKDFIENMTVESFVDLSLAELFGGKMVNDAYRGAPTAKARFRTASVASKQDVLEQSADLFSVIDELSTPDTQDRMQRVVDGQTYYDSNDFPRMTQEQAEASKANLTHKTAEDVLRAQAKGFHGENVQEGWVNNYVKKYKKQIQSERDLLNDAIKTSGYNINLVTQKLYDILVAEGANVRANMLKEFIDRGLFKDTSLVLDRGSLVSNAMGVYSSGGFWSDSRDDLIVINVPYQLSADWLTSIIIHEQMHRLTSLELNKKGVDSKYAMAMELIFGQIGMIANDRLSEQYGMQNTHELVAEAFSNLEFQSMLMETPMTDALKRDLAALGIDVKNKNLFEAFKSVVLEIMRKLGVKIKDKNMFDAVITATDNFLTGQLDSQDRMQGGVYRGIADMVSGGMKKGEIVAQLMDDGFTKKDAELMYAKAAGYKIGVAAGTRAGMKARADEYSAKRKAERANEREEAKAFRKRMKALYKQEKRITEAMLKDVVAYITEAKGINIKPSQLKAILRLMTAAHNKVRGKGSQRARNYAIYTAFVDKVATIIDKQLDAKAIEEQVKLLRKVQKQQQTLKQRAKRVKGGAKNPLISYMDEIDGMINLDPSMLSAESLAEFSEVLNELTETVKLVGTKTNKEGEKELSRPYVKIGNEYVDVRRGKIYFREMFNKFQNEEVQNLESFLIEQSVERAFNEGTTWLEAYEQILRERSEKEVTGLQKQLKDIAKEMDIDLNDVDGLEAALELYEEAKAADKEAVKSEIIDGAVIPTFNKWRELLMGSEFAEIFAHDPTDSDETINATIRERLDNLSLSELKRLEFYMFDYIVNGKAYGISSLAAAARAKNDGNAELAKLNMQANPTSGIAKSIRKGYFELFENTPSFFRRVFGQYSQAKVAQYINAIGFGDIRRAAVQADMEGQKFVQEINEVLEMQGLDNMKDQTRILIYSTLAQKPEGMTDAAWVLNVRKSLELALASDYRLSEEQKEMVQDAMQVFNVDGRSANLQEIMEALDADKKLKFMIQYTRNYFKLQEPAMQEYAEQFLGMRFEAKENYLPFRFRAVTNNGTQIEALQENIDNIQQAFKQHAQSKATAKAGAVYERNENAMASKNRYIDLFFFNSIGQTYKENEVKTRTAKAVAYTAAMTSEKNSQFTETIPDPALRSQVRKKIFNYLVNAADHTSADEVLGRTGARIGNYAMNMTVVAYFGATIEQVLKQASALANALIEARSMGAKMVYLETIMEAITPKFAQGEEGYRIKQAKADLMNQFEIGARDIVTETLMVGKSGEIGKKTRFEKGVELSTTALRETDKMAATSTWLAYYADYLIREEGVDGDTIDWDAEAANPNKNAGSYADQMTVKDQNINTRRDKSKLNSMATGTAMTMMKMVIMPFANFLLNKKQNLALDFQKLFNGDVDNRKEAIASLAGTVLEVAAFQGAAWMLLTPMYNALGAALFGGDDEEQSWWDKKFGKQMFIRGIVADMNPAILPIAAMENFYLRGINMANYMLRYESDDFQYADETWRDGFDRFERMYGLPIFSNAGRDDLSAGGFLSMLGVTGSVMHDMSLSIQNSISLLSDKPTYINSAGTKRYVSTEDAKMMALAEMMRAGLYGVMSMTGLYSKELAKIAKSGRKPFEKRSTKDIEQWIAGELMKGADASDMIEYLQTEVAGDPMNALAKIDTIVKKAKGSQVNELVSPANINTMRVIDKAETSNRGRAVMIHQIAAELDEKERQQFYLDAYIYFGVKYGVETVKSQIANEILKYGNNE